MDQSSTVKKPTTPRQSKLERIMILINKATKSKSKWESKDEFLDVVYWIRQILGLIMGLIWGLLSLKGLFAIISFVLVNGLIVYIFSVTFQQIDEDEYGGIWDVLKEGFMTSFSTFLVIWIVTYSALL